MPRINEGLPGDQERDPQEELREGTGERFAEAERIGKEGSALMLENNGDKPFHGIHHPENLKITAERLFSILNLSAEKRAVATLAIEFHDTIINEEMDVLSDKDPLLQRVKRKRGAKGEKGAPGSDTPYGQQGNEALSVHELLTRMEASGAFTPEEMNNAAWAIEATYPDVDFGNPPNYEEGKLFQDYPYLEVAKKNKDLAKLLEDLQEGGFTRGVLFHQPHLEKYLEEGKIVPDEVLVVALADLGAAGTREFDEFVDEGNREFRELHINFRDPDNLKKLDESQRKKMTKKFLDWTRSQVGFATFQALRFEKIVHFLEKNKQIDGKQAKELREQFGEYENNIRASVARSKDLETKFASVKETGDQALFEELAREMEYDI